MPYINGELKSSYTDSDLAHLISCVKWFLKNWCPKEVTDFDSSMDCPRKCVDPWDITARQCPISEYECSGWWFLEQLERLRKGEAK